MCHLVVSSTQLEAEDGLEIFSLEQNIAFQAVTEVGGMCEGCFNGGFVDASRQNESQVLDQNLAMDRLIS